MGRVSPFHSKSEASKPVTMQVYHSNDACYLARTIVGSQRSPGSGGYRMCKECDRLNRNDPHRSE
jgi:hypothetical protein